MDHQRDFYRSYPISFKFVLSSLRSQVVLVALKAPKVSDDDRKLDFADETTI